MAFSGVVTISPDLRLRIHQTALLIESLPSEPGDGAAEGLEALFSALHEADAEERAAIEIKIWQVWCGHDDEEVAAAMARAIGALNAGALADAESLLDGLVDSRPSWAEAWNKRATLYFVLGRDAESVGDIRRTLSLEPRHFGALCGFAEIADRSGDAHAARVALTRALEVRPGLAGVASAIEGLRDKRPETLH